MMIKYPGVITKFRIPEHGIKAFLITGHDGSGELKYVGLQITKQGSVVSGLCESLTSTINQALDARVIPLLDILKPLVDMRYEPMGITDDPDIPHVLSISDYVAKRLALDYLEEEDWVRLGM